MTTLFDRDWEHVWNGLVSGMRRFMDENGFEDVVLGLSGGMDSSLTAALAVDTLGRDHVHGVLMPSPWSSEGSVTDAELLARNLGIATETILIKPMMDAFEGALTPVFADRPVDVTKKICSPASVA